MVRSMSREEFFAAAGRAGVAPPGRLSSDASLDSILGAQERRFATHVDPIIRSQLDSFGSNDFVEQAKESSAQAFEGAEESVQRRAQGLGLSLTPSQLKAFRRRAELGETTQTINNVSNARTAQRDRDISTLASLSNSGQGLSGTGTQGIAAGARRDAQRENTNDANSAQHTNSLIGAAGTAAMMAMMI